MRSYGFKHLKNDNLRSFYAALECDGTIGAMSEHQNSYHVELLTGDRGLYLRTDLEIEYLNEVHDELCVARWGLMLAFSNGLDEVHVCRECGHLSNVEPCACGKGRGFTKLYSLDWASWNIFDLDMAQSWLKECFKQLGEAAFHPDNAAAELQEEDGTPVFTPEECEFYDRNMDKCVELFEAEGIDIYAWCLEELFQVR